jgi:hypothetical protein
MSHKTKFNYYPYRTSKNFNEEIYNKKEFYINKTKKVNTKKSIEELMDEKCSGFRLSDNQKFLKTFMSSNTPYNGLLLFHGTGVGKTCSSISIAEQYTEVLEKYNKKIFILLNPSIEDNFRKNIFNPASLRTKKVTQQCLGDKYLKKIKTYKNRDFDRENLPESEIDKITRKVDNRIKSQYRFQGYQEFSNKLIRLKDRLKTRPGAYEKRINEFFSNSVLIIDEAHNIKDTNKDKQIPKILEEVLDNTDDLKLILLTATPMFNEPQEIVFLLNLLLRNEKEKLIESSEVFNADGTLTKEGAKILREKSRGVVSYLRGENPLAFPMRLDPHKDTARLLSKDEFPVLDFKNNRLEEKDKLNHLKIIPCLMESETPQRVLYNKIADIGFGAFESVGLSVSNIAFPGTEGADYQKQISNEGFFNNFEKNVVGGKVKITPKNAEAENMLKLSEIGKYSAKMEKIIQLVSDPNTEGVIFIYSRFVWGGAVMLGLLLEMEGFQNDNGNLLGKNIGQKKDKKGNYMIISGDQELSRNNYIDYIKKESRNKDGKKLKIILGSESASEGLDFKYIREVHILDPWHHLNKIEQVIGRGIRYCSHIELPLKERNVTVFMYAAVTNKNPSLEKETADLKVYRDAENKDKNMADVTYELKKGAVDCNLNLYANKFVDPYFAKQEKKITDSKGKPRKVNFQDEDGSRICNYRECDFTCEPNLKPELELEQSKIDTDTFDPSVVVENINQVIEIIKGLFAKESIQTLADIEKEEVLVKMNIDSDFIQLCIDTMVKNDILLRDKFNNVGKLFSRGKYYIFVPTYIKTDKITFREITRPLTEFTGKVNLNADLADLKLVRKKIFNNFKDTISVQEINEMIDDLDIKKKMYYLPNFIKEYILKHLVKADLNKSHPLHKYLTLRYVNLSENILTRNNTVDFINPQPKDSTFGYFTVTDSGVKVVEYLSEEGIFREASKNDVKLVLNYLRRKAKSLTYKKAKMFAYIEMKKDQPIFKVLDNNDKKGKPKKQQSTGIILRSQGMARSALDTYIKRLLNLVEFYERGEIYEDFNELLELYPEIKQIYADIETKKSKKKTGDKTELKDKNNLYDVIEERFLFVEEKKLGEPPAGFKWFFTNEEYYLNSLKD